jgi:hypothetical protein
VDDLAPELKSVDKIRRPEKAGLLKHPHDSVTSQGWIRIHLPVDLLGEVLTLMRRVETVKVSFAGDHAWFATDDQKEASR